MSICIVIKDIYNVKCCTWPFLRYLMGWVSDSVNASVLKGYPNLIDCLTFSFHVSQHFSCTQLYCIALLGSLLSSILKSLLPSMFLSVLCSVNYSIFFICIYYFQPVFYRLGMSRGIYSVFSFTHLHYICSFLAALVV